MTGLQKLYPLSLDRTPAADILPGTAMAWIQAITHNRAWDQYRDTPRIRGAFTTLAQSCDRWPSPKQFMEALPQSEQPRLTKQPGIPSTKEEREANLARLRQLYGDVINPID